MRFYRKHSKQSKLFTQSQNTITLPGGRAHLLVVPGVHSNRSVEEVLSHVSFQPQSIWRIHPSFLSLLTKSHKLKAASFFRYSLQRVRKSLEAGAQQQQPSPTFPFPHHYHSHFPHHYLTTNILTCTKCLVSNRKL